MTGEGHQSPHLVALGVIRKPIGLDGACAFQPFGQTLGRLTLPVQLFAGEGETTCRPLLLEQVELRPKGPVCFFREINDADNAETLRNFNLYIDQHLLPHLEDGAYYQFELEGMKVQTDRGREIGIVESIENYPTVDSIQIRRSNGETVMVPLTGEAVTEVDRMSGSITVREEFIEELL
ncbi:MAG: 16S rRNA processing protein RimM [Chitinispirillaceae bacterium]|nr:16S rRNA processing protein RimM [Chitinispirillaceae bacterium]